MGASGGAWPVDPGVAIADLFHAAGHLGRPHRDQVRLLAATTSTPTRSNRRSAPAQAWEEGRFAKSVVPVQDVNGLTILDRDEHMRPSTDMQSLAAAQGRPSCRWARWAASTRSRSQAHPDVESVNHVHHAGNSSGIVDGAAAVLVGSKEAGERRGLKPRARIRAFASIGSDLGAHAHRARSTSPRLVLRKAGMTQGRYRPLRDQRGLLLGGAALHAGLRPRSGARSTSTAAPSPWAIRSARPAR